MEEFTTECDLKIENVFKNKLNDINKIDKMMEDEELFFNSITNDLSNYYNSYDNFKKNNEINDLLLNTQIYINDYNRNNIDNDSIKTEFKFGWFILYNIKKK